MENYFFLDFLTPGASNVNLRYVFLSKTWNLQYIFEMYSYLPVCQHFFRNFYFFMIKNIKFRFFYIFFRNFT